MAPIKTADDADGKRRWRRLQPQIAQMNNIDVICGAESPSAISAVTQMAQMERGDLDKITKRVIGIAMKIHNALGPGFVEKIYEKAMAYEFKLNKMEFAEQAEIDVKYGTIDLGYQRVDFLVENEVIVELKSVGELNSIHSAQMLSYLKTANKKVGLILNFAESKLGIK
ncbi:MAG: GxxExxY protein, partial [Candidatus Omnitrophota bacterium]|nr:GxxExxY protein [Candidatus Omnitrophota bacterium]